MANEYRVEPYSPSSRSAVLGMMDQLFPGKTTSQLERYFAWKYEENPYLSEPLLALVFSGSQLVGMRGMIGSRWAAPELGQITLPAAEDLVIDTAHRNRGIFLLLDRAMARIAADRGFPAVLSLSARNEITQKLQAATGWRTVIDLEAFVRPSPANSGPIRSRQVVQRLIGKTLQMGRRLGLTESMDRLLEARDLNPEVRLLSEPPFQTLAPEPRTLAEDVLSPVRDETYYRWRLANPFHRYHYLVWGDPAARGFLILGRLTPPSRQIRIIDSFADDAVMGQLLTSLFRAKKPSFVIATRSVPAEPAGLGLGRRRQEFVRIAARPTGQSSDIAPMEVDLIDTMLV